MRIFVLLFALFSAPSFAQSASCLPQWTSLQTLYSIDTSAGRSTSLPLLSQNANGLFQTKVVLDADYDQSTNSIALSVQFTDPNEVSLPYNLYAVLVVESGKPIAYFDFTKSCTEPGVGFYPGESFDIGRVSLTDRGSSLPIQIVIWGQL